MKLFSASIEKLAIKTILSGSKNHVANRLLGTLNQEHFHYPPAREAFDRIKFLVSENGNLPSWLELINDPIIDQSNREIWQGYNKKHLKRSSAGKTLIEQLEQFRILRQIYYRSKQNIESFRQESIDVDKLLDENRKTFSQQKLLLDPDQVFRHFGSLNNSSGLLDRLKKGEITPRIPTGIEAFDRRNVGIALGDLFLMAATTGGGKTAIAMQIGINMALQGARVAHINLEMSKDELECRLMSNLSKTSHDKFLSPKDRMGPEDYRQIEKAEKRFNKRLKQLDSLFTFVVPDIDPTIEELFIMLAPYKYQVLIVDMLNLLAGIGGDNQWRKLGDAARFAKRFASTNECIVILLCQLTQEGMIRYSRELGEHASVFWSWVATEESRKNQVQKIRVVKARNQATFDFKLRTDFSHMRFVSATVKEDQDQVEQAAPEDYYYS